MYDKTKFIYVGLDLHKEQHTAVIMDCFNEKLGEITFQNKPSEFGKLITKCKKYRTDGKGIVFALENSYGYGRALAAWLIERNYIVKDVNPALSYAYRKKCTSVQEKRQLRCTVCSKSKTCNLSRHDKQKVSGQFMAENDRLIRLCSVRLLYRGT